MKRKRAKVKNEPLMMTPQLWRELGFEHSDGGTPEERWSHKELNLCFWNNDDRHFAFVLKAVIDKGVAMKLDSFFSPMREFMLLSGGGTWRSR
jgi:hypothetical protein